MLALSSGLLRTGLALKLNQVKRATSSYLRDRTNQATGTMTSYAIAAALFASVRFAVALASTAASLVPRMFTVTVVVVPSAAATVKLSV